MGLKATPVSRCLDKKLLVFGYEVPDLLAVFFLLAILNFVFGQTSYRISMVWGPAAALAVVIRLGKRGKPDNYLVHLAKFKIKPRYLSAFSDPSKQIPPPKLGPSGF